MKSISATFFVFLYLLALIRPVMPVFEYIVDQDYIAEFLCINTDKPELQCNGKCYLMQQLDKQNEDKRQNLPEITMEEYPIGFVEFIYIKFQKEEGTPLDIPVGHSNDYNFMFSDSNFRPPTYFG